MSDAAKGRPKPADDEDDINPYGVKKESEEELRLIEKNKPRFGDVQDKFKRSARGPASGLLVMPVNLLLAEGALLGVGGVLTIMIGFWPLVFTDAPPSDEEYVEQLQVVFIGFVALTWGSLICFGASKMQALESYAWALAGAVLGVFPLLVGIFAIITLRDPRVIAGFEEVEGALDEDDDDDNPAAPKASRDDEEEDEEEEEEPKPRKRRK